MMKWMNEKGSGVMAGLGVVALVAVSSAGAFMLGMNMKNPLDREIVSLAGPVDDNALVSAFDGNDPVVAQINNHNIMRSEVLVALSDMAQGVTPESARELFPEFLDQYVNIVLLTDAAREAGVDKSDSVQAEMDLAESQILRAAFLNAQFQKALDESNLKAMYEQLVVNQPDQDEVSARHILVDDEAKAKDLIKQAKRGGDFAALAQEHSTGPTGANGGDLGYFVQSQMVPEFAEAAFNMEVGSISDAPVQTQFGWHVIKVEDRRAVVKPSYEEMREALAQQLRQSVTQSVVQSLRGEAEVILFTMDGEPMPEAAPEEAAAPAAPSTSAEPAAAPAAAE